VESLGKELASETSPPIVRQLAGIVLKNAISGAVSNSGSLRSTPLFYPILLFIDATVALLDFRILPLIS